MAVTEWEPATEVEAAMWDALRASDQELYFRILARSDLLLPVSADALAGHAPMGWGTWTTAGRTHVLGFTSEAAARACMAENAGPTRRVPYADLANDWPNLEWWLAVNPGLPIEGYLPAWFVAQLARGDVRLPGRSMGARARLERAESAARARATAVVPGRDEPTSSAARQPTAPPSPAPSAPRQPGSPPPAGPVTAAPSPPFGGTPAAPPQSFGAHVAPPQSFRPTPAAAQSGPLPLRTPEPPLALFSPPGHTPASPEPKPAPVSAPHRAYAPPPVAETVPPAPAREYEASATTSGWLTAANRKTTPEDAGNRDTPTSNGFFDRYENATGAAAAESDRPVPPMAGPDRPGPATGFRPIVIEGTVVEPRDDVPAQRDESMTAGGFQSTEPVRTFWPDGTAPTGQPPVEPLSYEPRPHEPMSYEPLSPEPLSPPMPYEPISYEPLSPEPMSYEPLADEPLVDEPATGEPLPDEPVQVDAPAPEDFRPANDVEESLLSAAGDGSTDTFLSTLLLARVLLPVSPASTPGSLPGQDGFVWLTEDLDGEPYVVVYTSPERLADRVSTPVETVRVKFVQLIQKWPDEAWSFAVNPGTPVGAKLPGGQIVALASWAAELGLGDGAGESVEAPPVEEPAPRTPYAPAVEEPGRPTMMQKTVAPSQIAYYLDRGYDRISGFVHRSHEVAHLNTPAKLHAALGLSHPGSPFSPDDTEVFVLRWPAHRPSLYRIPYGGQSEAAMRAMEGWVIERPPFRGNGFAPGESSDVIAEFKVDSARLPHGAQLWRIGVDGDEQVLATLDSDSSTWRRVEGQ